jgi:long-chain acyl-CoA synthetase
MGVKGDKIALISSSSRTRWNIMDIGVLQTGCANSTIIPTISENDYEYIFKPFWKQVIVFLPTKC